MIDFKKELSNFNFFELDHDFLNRQQEASLIIEPLQNSFKRFSKEQNKTNTQLEAIYELTEMLEAKLQAIELLQVKTNTENQERLKLIKVFISILDQLEILYRYSLQHESASRQQQMQLIWENTAQTMLPYGLVRIEGEAAFFNPQLQTIINTESRPDLPAGIVLEVLKSGYLYQNEVLRKAEIILNKYRNEAEDE